MEDRLFLQLAIKQSELSVKDGKFPAGAIVAKGQDVLSRATSDVYPGYHHAEAKAVDNAFQVHGKLLGATLYASMEPCLMCIATAYWAGVRRVVYAIPRKELTNDYYEASRDTHDIIQSLNEQVEYTCLEELKDAALKVVREWEEASSN